MSNDVIVLVDGSGLFHATKKHLNFRPNLKAVLRKVSEGRKVAYSKCYIGLPPSMKKPEMVFNALKRAYSKVHIWEYEPDKPVGERGGHEPLMITDALTLAHEYPAADFVLVTGNAMFIPLVQKLQADGKLVNVAFVSDCMSRELALVASSVIPLRQSVAL